MAVAEVQAINYILQSGLKSFRSDYFVDYLKQFEYIEDFYKKYGQLPDKVTFLSKFDNFKIFAVSDPKESILERLREEAFAKKLIPIYNKCSDMIASGNSIEAAKLLEDSISSIKKALTSESFKPVNITDYETKVKLYSKVKNDLELISTGYPEINRLIGGWSPEEDLVVLFARPGVGKSWMAIRFAYELVKQGKTVGFYAGEMSASKLSFRMDSFNTGTSNFKLQMGGVEEADYEDIAKQMSDLPGKMLVITPSELNGSASVSDLETFIEESKLDCLFIDQISLIKRDGRKKTGDAISQIANELRILQTVKKIPIFVVSQQNRASLQEGSVGIEHLAQADDIGQNATIVIAFEYDKESRHLIMNFVKSRNSEQARFVYMWDIDRGKQEYIPHEMANVDVKDTTDYGDQQGDQPF